MTTDEIRALLTGLNATPAITDGFIGVYVSQSQAYQQGADALLHDLTGAEATEDDRMLIVAQLFLLQDLSCSIHDEPLQFFEVLRGQFTPNQRIQCCKDMGMICGLVPAESRGTVLRDMVMYGTIPLYAGAYENPKFSAIMAQRINLLCCFLSGLSASGTAVAVFSGRACDLLPTGSDPHMNHKQVVILRARSDKSLLRVYKPRSVFPDRAVQRCLEVLNKGLPSELRLPVLDVKPDASDTCGSEALARKKDTMDPTTAARYYRQMGALICITKLIGLTDVHQDNVMPTETGPVVIDAECALDPWIMRSGELFATCMNAALAESGTEQGPDTALAQFTISGRGKSDDLFRSYAGEIRAGYSLALTCCRGLREELFTLIARQMATVRKIRYVPLGTGSFYEMAGNYYYDAALTGQNTYKTLAGRIARFGLPAQEGGYPGWRKELERSVRASLDRGDVPYFTLSMPGSGSAAGDIACDGVVVGNAGYLFKTPIESVLEENLNFLESVSARAQLELLLQGG
ncbi:hypothetical protein CE91St41_31630 [Oscillospiraceae bacterium]|nr:hypothetical protein CE91St40_31630 [Oscillospiraceae bacterium]BDF76274.1 hypothetical protein CE91St41_31630 [Oscillospiraceae bacterium]